MIGLGSASGSRVVGVVNGVNYGSKDENDRNNNPWRVSNVIADVNGEIDIDFVRGPGSTYTYPCAIFIKRHAA